jgi:GT2 family glycosyltransferase
MNRLADLKGLMNSLSSQTEPDLEFVFVAENSNTLLQQVRSYASDRGLVGTFLMNQGARGLSESRNIGAENCRGSIIAMIDDDVVLPKTWAASILKAFEDDHVIGVTGPALPLWEEEKMYWLPEEFYWLISCTGWGDFQDGQEVRSAAGMNMAFREEAFVITGGLPKGSGFHMPIAEDLAFSLEIKKRTAKRIVYCKEAYVWHRVHSYRFNWQYIGARSRHIGTSRYILRTSYRIEMDRESKLLWKMIQNFPGLLSAVRGKSVKVLELELFVGINLLIGYASAMFRY